jgi:hypothetical protein
MSTLINKIRSTLSNMVLFATAVVMAGIGFAVFATLTVFAFFAVGLALLSSPFVGVSKRAGNDAQEPEIIV